MKKLILALIASILTATAANAAITINAPEQNETLPFVSGAVYEAIPIDVVSDTTSKIDKLHFSTWISAVGVAENQQLQSALILDENGSIVDEVKNPILGNEVVFKVNQTFIAGKHYRFQVVVTAGWWSLENVGTMWGIYLSWVETPQTYKIPVTPFARFGYTWPDSYWPNSIQAKRDMIVPDGSFGKSGMLAAFRFDSWNESQTLDTPTFEVVGTGDVSKLGLLYLTDVFGKKICKPTTPVQIEPGRVVYKFNALLNIPVGGATFIVKSSATRYKGSMSVSAITDQMFPVGAASGYQTRVWGDGGGGTVIGATISK